MCRYCGMSRNAAQPHTLSECDKLELALRLCLLPENHIVDLNHLLKILNSCLILKFKKMVLLCVQHVNLQRCFPSVLLDLILDMTD